MKFIVTGGAGYVGSHFVKLALDKGHEVVILDDLSTGHESFTEGCNLVEADLTNYQSYEKNKILENADCIFHFAGKSLVAESILKPELYLESNLLGTINLLKLMKKNEIKNIVFSSSAAVYGNPESNKKINEENSKKPINPYGLSKLYIEKILEDYSAFLNINAVCFRYFNAAGAHPIYNIGEDHNPETHLIPNILKSIHSETSLKIFGSDYKTFDGTCIRDYIHVCDLADAHLLGFEYLCSEKGFHTYNLGNGNGFSILEIIKACEKVTNKKVDYEFSHRRDGDPAMLVADCTKVETDLNWIRNYSNIEKIIDSAWKWHKFNENKKK